MLLFSTVLPACKTLEPSAFYETMIDWNQNYSRPENQIEHLDWTGEWIQTFEDKNLKMEFDCFEEEGLYGARFTKDQNGVLWRTDALLQKNENKILVQLDRSYTPGAAVLNEHFSTPKLIETMIDHHLLDDLPVLPFSTKPITITSKQAGILEEIFYGKISLDLPVVLISAFPDGQLPLNPEDLAWRLKGAAHVLVLKDDETQPLWWNESFSLQMPDAGLVSITYPNAAKTIEYHQTPPIDVSNMLLEEICSHIFRYNQQLEKANLPAWMLLKAHKFEQTARQESLRHSSQTQEFSELFDLMSNESQSLSSQLIALQAENNAMREALRLAEHQKSKAAGYGLLNPGKEKELYPGEISDYVIEALKQTAAGSFEQGRKADILQDLIANNPPSGQIEARKEFIRQAISQAKSFERILPLLTKAGFEIIDEGKHYKLIYGHDKRYTFTIGRTPSDFRAAKNNISIILQKLFK